MFVQQAKSIVAHRGNTTFATWYNENGKQVDEYTFDKLWKEAGYIANALRNKWNVDKGDLVVLCYDFGLHFFSAFLGCLRAGVTAVIVYPPGPPLVKSLTKMNNVINDCSPVLILTDSKVNLLRKADLTNPFSKSKHLWPTSITMQVTNIIARLEKKAFDEPNINPQDLAFLQYTSGSTGNPKGVMVTHSALTANVQLLGDGFKAAFQQDGLPVDNLIGFSWLPQYHDLGLIYCCITPFTNGWTMHMMSPIAFIQNPLLWIELISKHKVQWSAAPDFAYRLVTRKFIQAQQSKSKAPSLPSLPDHANEPIPNLDLSCVHHLQCSSEPIRLETIQSFTEAFGDYKLSKSWFAGGYGLAETVVGVCWLKELSLSTEPENRGIHDDKTSVALVQKEQEQSRFVAVGERSNFHSSLIVKIVDPKTQVENKDGVSGEIWLSGPSIAAGYFGQPQLSQEVFGARLVSPPEDDKNDNHIENEEANQAQQNQNIALNNNEIKYLRTGDRGFFQDNRLYICGRYKDLIIMNGVNYYPQDIENVVQDVSQTSIRPGCCAAFSSNDTSHDGDIVIIFEIRSDKNKQAKQVCLDVQSVVSKKIGLVPTVVAIQEKTICKTTSGKIQRRRNRTYWQEGKHNIIFQTDKLKSVTTLLPLSGNNHRDKIDLAENSSFNSKISCTDNGNMTVESLAIMVLGSSFDKKQTWEDMGLTSILATQLRDQLDNHFAVTLPPDCFERYPTVTALEDYIRDAHGSHFDSILPELPRKEGRQLKWWITGIIQVVGVLCHLILFSFSFLLPYVLARSIPSDQYLYAVLYPLIIPVWMASFSLFIVAAKWIIIGKYKPCEVVVPSVPYLQWWWVDRGIHVWELFIGKVIKGTFFHWLIYFLMGAKIHPSVTIDAFIREFDLVEIGKGSTIDYDIQCRKFHYQDDDNEIHKNKESLGLYFRNITIGDNCQVKGLISPGAVLGDNVELLELSVIAEGNQVPSGVIASGNPAYSTDLAKQENQPTNNTCSRFMLVLLKVCWLFVVLYLYFGLLFIGRLLLNDIFPEERQYISIYCWGLLYFMVSYLSILINIIMKWILIGRRRPGPILSSPTSIWRLFADWAVDCHFLISTGVLMKINNHSKSWNYIFMLYGLDTDQNSKFDPTSIVPSKVDLIKIRSSYVASRMTMSTKANNNEYHAIEILESSVGNGSHLGHGIKISKAIIPSTTRVDESVMKLKIKDEYDNLSEFNLLTWKFFVSEVLYIANYILHLTTAGVPVLFILNLFEPQSAVMVVLALVLILVMQMILSALVVILLEWVTNGCKSSNRSRTSPWTGVFIWVALISGICSGELLSLLPLFWASPFYKYFFMLRGAAVNGNLLYNGNVAFDQPYLTFEDNTVIDGAGLVIGHSTTYNRVTLGPDYLSGIVHRGVHTMANTTITTRETGPLKAIVGTLSGSDNKLDVTMLDC